MNTRINFYLGQDLTKENISNLDLKNINKDDENKKSIENLVEENNYDPALKNLLIKTKHITENFYFKPGDINKPFHSLVLCKNRCAGNKNSVILRCLNFHRHWKNYYNRPQDIPFNKKKNKVFWRGVSTGNETNVANRFQLIKRWCNKCDIINVGFSNLVQNINDRYTEKYKKFVKGSCNLSQFLKFKYILSVEGNDKDTGLNWKLNSNSVVMMAKPRVCSWLMETTLIPNYHYILLKDDFSDLKQKVIWCNNHPERCKQIVRNARKFMKQFSNAEQEEKIEMAVINKYFEILKKIKCENNNGDADGERDRADTKNDKNKPSSKNEE